MPRNEEPSITTARTTCDDRATTGRFARKASPLVMSPTVTTRRRTALDVRRFDAAITLLLSEMVRAEFGRAGGET